MNAIATSELKPRVSLDEAVDTACGRIAPAWPLDRAIAVNPYWGRLAQRFEDVDAALGPLAGTSLWMAPAYYRAAWDKGDIDRSHLNRALVEADADDAEAALLAALGDPQAAPPALPLPSDFAAGFPTSAGQTGWGETILDQISRFCAAYFDADQADWRQTETAGLYEQWRRAFIADHGATLPDHTGALQTAARALPASDPRAVIRHAVDALELDHQPLADCLEAALLRVGGWASWCAYRRWQARLAGRDDDAIEDLLAIRLAWEWLLDDGARGGASAWGRWRSAWQAPTDETAATRRRRLSIWHRALEIAYQQPLAEALATSAPAPEPAPEVQAVFCIDVRSEVFRRALEGVAGGVQTRGFAGFFGLPVSYSPLGTAAERPQLPGLLAPALQVRETTGDASADEAVARRREQRLARAAARQPFTSLPASAFSLVETLGLGYLGKLVRKSVTGTPASGGWGRAGLSAAESEQLTPTLTMVPAGERVDLAERVLRAMGLTQGLAGLVVLVGHGSASSNNPQAAALDCGACCGQSGEVNARALAALLNDAVVRDGLTERGIHIPESSHFLPALHNTTTDEVAVFDADTVPAEQAGRLAQLRVELAAAGERARAERAPGLGLSALKDKPRALLKAVRARSRDWAQTRPEWGLANNAAFVVAPRARTRDVDLGGRAFLHDYDWRQDTDGSVLALIMTAPMVVTHWINMQYYASTVDNQRYGSGNKVLHNVVGGRIGVFEGNGGDLRVGLARQSVHDGNRWMHTPLRLSVFIEAPRAMIERVIGDHETVAHLVHNRWLHLFRLDDDGVEAYRAGAWQPWAGPEAA